ncbi:MAG: PfkB family carbohydrate kinase [Phycisphaerae bacterium]
MVQPLARKIVSMEELGRTRQLLRDAGKTVVQCHGCFDIVHPGHIRYLQFARELGDVLVVSLTGDLGIRKGVDRPYIPQDLRAENLAALEFVDWVVIDSTPTACELLAAIQPDVYVKGREYATADDPRFAREREIVESYGGRVVFHSGDVVFSSTRLIENLGTERAFDEPRLRAFCVRSSIDLTRCRAMLERFRRLRVVVFGDVLRERYVSCDAGRTADDAPILALQQLALAEFWGGAARLAVQLQALGAKPLLITAIGDDEASRHFAERFNATGVEHHFLKSRADLPERTTYVADDNKLFRVSTGRCAPLDSATERAALEAIRAALPDAQLVVWGDHGLGAVTPQLQAHATLAARHAGLRVAGYAVGATSDLAGMGGLDLLTASERQLRDAMHDMHSGLPAVAWNLLHAGGSKRLIVSLRRRGVIGFDGQASALTPDVAPERLRSEFVPPLRGAGVDFLGCDEALLAAAALTLSADGTLPSACYLAAAAETLAAGHGGAAAITARELGEFLVLRPELRPESRFQTDRPSAASAAADVALVEAYR